MLTRDVRGARFLTVLLAMGSACGSSTDGAPSSSTSARAEAAPASGAPTSPPTAPTAAVSGSASTKRAHGPTAAVELFEVPGGKVVLHPVHHATLYLEAPGVTIWVDPWTEGHLDGLPPGDLVLVTDVHPDHLDAKAIAQVKKADATVVGPKSIASDVPGLIPMSNGESRTFGSVEVTAVPMYNEKRGPGPGKLFHDKGRGNGYVLSIGGKRLYLSGDTECTSEMKALAAIDVALVCMNLPYTMPPSEAAACVAAFKPGVLIPYHYRDSNLADLDAPLASSGVEVKKVDFYPER